MRVIFWRIALIAILLITLIGSIVLLFQEPTLPSIIGVIGAIGSLMGAFVTTGLDITRRPPEPRDMYPPATSPAAPYVHSVEYPIHPSHRAPTVQGEVRLAEAPRSSRLSFAAMTQAATIGAMMAIVTGVFYASPSRIGQVFCCLQWTAFVMTGALYVLFARREDRAQKIGVGSALVGGLLTGIAPAVVAMVTDQFSKFVIWQSYVDYLTQYFELLEFTPTDYYVFITMTSCLIVGFEVVLAGIGAALFAVIFRGRTSQP